MKKTLLLLLTVSLLIAHDAEAQRRGERIVRNQLMANSVGPEIGIRGAYDFDRRDFGAGGQLQIPLLPLLSLVPSGDFHFGADTTWQANADVGVNLRVLRAGGGLALVDGTFVGNADDDPEVGLNLFAGVHAPVGRDSLVRPYAEARWTFLQNQTPFYLVAGMNARIGGGRADRARDGRRRIREDENEDRNLETCHDTARVSKWEPTANRGRLPIA